MEFYVPDEEEMSGADEEQWFNPVEGIGLVEAMAAVLEMRKTGFQSYERLKEDLDDFRSILDRSASMGRKWNLGMDT